MSEGYHYALLRQKPFDERTNGKSELPGGLAACPPGRNNYNNETDLVFGARYSGQVQAVLGGGVTVLR
jgi:hypothetical protein